MDQCMTKNLEPGGITFRTMKEGIGGSKGLIDFALLKFDMRDYVLSLDFVKNMSERCAQMVKSALSSHDDYRMLVDPYPGEDKVDTTWRSDMEGSDNSWFDLAEVTHV